jgi:hypothetical protein
MKFVLEPHHRNVPDKELIFDLIKVANKLKKDSITQDDYNNHGTYCAATFKKRFGTWFKSIELAGLKKSRNINIPSEDMINDLLEVSRILNKNYVTTFEYDKLGKFSSGGLARRFGTWAKTLHHAGLQQPQNIQSTEIDLYKELITLWTKLGRQPVPRDLESNNCHHVSTYSRKFGSWRKALESFVLWANKERGDDINDEIEVNDNSISTLTIDVFDKRKTSRNVSDRMRFKILLRDNFSCKSCGASPAKTSGVELHVDHIIPWSKGGETIDDNLETKCSKCNLGKGNAFNR